MNDLAAFLRTSGAIFGTSPQYSPTNHSILALAEATVTLSVRRATILIRSLFSFGWSWSNFLITTILSATTASVGEEGREKRLRQEKFSKFNECTTCMCTVYAYSTIDVKANYQIVHIHN